MDFQKINFLVLCGLPASGKSTFAEFLRSRLDWKIFSQDESGNKAAFLQALGQSGKTPRQGGLAVDRCNQTRAKRSEILEISGARDAVCVWFAFDAELCVDRAARRVNHATLKGGTGRSAISAVASEFETPTLDEGFSAVVRLASLGAVEELLIKLVHGNSHIHKFPRTRHLANLGSASRDDLILGRAEAEALLRSPNILVQEKIDGANIGISIDPASLNFRVQNRSHYITAQSHEQFRKLDKWLDAKKSDLWNILTRENPAQFPGRFILFGEWMAAKHSIHYSRLPDIFMAFDLFDVLEGKFVSRKILENLIAPTSLALVRNLELGGRLTVDSLVAKLKSGVQSLYADETVEGFYIRSDGDHWLLARAKIVRPDFICGDDHWAKAAITWNTISSDSVV